MERIKLGIITAPVGIKGEVRVYPFTDEITRFSAIKELEIENTPAVIENCRYQKDMVVLKLSVIPDRNAAEAARNKTLYLRKENLWEVPKDTYFCQDLIGMKVVSVEGEELGTLVEVIKNTAYQDIYRVEKPDGKDFMIPAVKEFIEDVNIDGKIITVKLIEGLTDL